MHEFKTPTHVLDFYTSICACPCTTQHCPGTINDSQKGIPPRGFYTLANPNSLRILIVGKNPGHVLTTEKTLYLNRSPDEIAKTQFDLIHQTFQTCHTTAMRKNRSLTFHRNLLRYFSYFLDVPTQEVFFHCAYTNVVKCQTVDEQARLDKTTIANCMKRHFDKERAYFKPKLFIALGQESFQALSILNLNAPLLKLKHPSYFYKKENEAAILQELKEKIQKAITT